MHTMHHTMRFLFTSTHVLNNLPLFVIDINARLSISTGDPTAACSVVVPNRMCVMRPAACARRHWLWASAALANEWPSTRQAANDWQARRELQTVGAV